MSDKLNHHYLPKFYLKGFVSESDISGIWEYQRGRTYRPGRTNRVKYNPALVSLQTAGASMGEYAYARSDGTVDYNTYEDALERLEKPADAVFNRIRNLQPIFASDREILVAYMVMMMKRVPARKGVINEQFPPVLEEQWRKITAEIEQEYIRTDPTDESAIKLIAAKFKACQRIIEEYRQNGMPPEMALKTMVDGPMPRVMDAIGSMIWQFVVAPDNGGFVTGDNPVHTFKGGVGLNKPYSEIVFPISSRVALLGTFRDVATGFFPASDQLLKEINRRVVANSTTYVYSSRKEPWIIKVMDKIFHRFNLIYPAPELTSQIKL